MIVLLLSILLLGDLTWSTAGLAIVETLLRAVMPAAFLVLTGVSASTMTTVAVVAGCGALLLLPVTWYLHRKPAPPKDATAAEIVKYINTKSAIGLLIKVLMASDTVTTASVLALAFSRLRGSTP
jgi:hypothetical protein